MNVSYRLKMQVTVFFLVNYNAVWRQWGCNPTLLQEMTSEQNFHRFKKRALDIWDSAAKTYFRLYPIFSTSFCWFQDLVSCVKLKRNLVYNAPKWLLQWVIANHNLFHMKTQFLCDVILKPFTATHISFEETWTDMWDWLHSSKVIKSPQFLSHRMTYSSFRVTCICNSLFSTAISTLWNYKKRKIWHQLD